MAIVKFSVGDFQAALGAPAPVAVPLGEPVSHVRLRSVAAEDGAVKAGVWQCTPGRWRRQVKQAEFCHFIEGDCAFIPDDGEPVEIRAGDVLFFPANSAGTWDVRTLAKKIYIVFG